MRASVYRNYTIFESGKIYDEECRPVLVKEDGNIEYKEKNGTKYTIECIPAKLFVYQAFWGRELQRTEFVYCKDADEKNLALSNLDIRDVKGKKEPVRYMGYDIYADGNIISPKNHKLSIAKNGTVGINMVGQDGISKKHMIVAGRMVYEAFSGYRLDKNTPLCYVDGNKQNIRIENLYVQSRRKYFSDTKKHMKFSEEQCIEIRNLYKNSETYDTMEIAGSYPSLMTMAKQFNCGISTMQKILGKSYKERDFEDETERFVFEMKNEKGYQLLNLLGTTENRGFCQGIMKG